MMHLGGSAHCSTRREWALIWSNPGRYLVIALPFLETDRSRSKNAANTHHAVLPPQEVAIEPAIEPATPKVPVFGSKS
jgi:hypothetical protein